VTELPECPVTKPEPPTPLQRAAERIAENAEERAKAEKWWKMNRVERMTQSEIVEMERKAGNRATLMHVNHYIVAYEQTSPQRQTSIDKAAAVELYEAEIDRIVGKQKEIEAWNNEENPAGPLSPHSRFQTWGVLEAMKLQVMDKSLRARGVELGDAESRTNLAALPPDVRKQVYEALNKSRKTTVRETTREVVMENKSDGTDAGPTPRIIEADPA
jgi:hypothetical protein